MIPFKPKSIARMQGGLKAQRAGVSFENVIAISQVDQQGQVVKLKKLPPCGAAFHGPGKAHPLPIACDYIGSVIGPGIALFFDAKSCGPDAYGINLADPEILKPHQADFLYEQAEVGAIAGILAECRRLGDYRWLHGGNLGTKRAYTAWHDDRWILLGSITHRVNFRTLVKAYLGEVR